MPFQPAPNVALLEVVMQLAGQKVENTTHWLSGDGWDQASLLRLAELAVSWWVSDFSPPLSQALSLVLCQATDLSTQNGATATSTPSVPATGGQGPDIVPNNVALTLSFRSAARGRSARGRNYICGFAKQQVIANTIETAAINSLKAAFTELFTVVMASEGFVPVVLSRRANKAIRPVAVTFPITSVVAVDPTVDSQRRRLPGRGK